MARLRRDLDRLGIPGKVQGIVIGASGGPDSTALAILVAGVRDASKSRSFPPVWLGHVHHCLRGIEADADRDFVARLAGELGFGFVEARIDVPALAKKLSASFESAGRVARQRAFMRWARTLPADAIALAHTADDQAETVLLRIFRSCGLRGLGGIPPERPLSIRQPCPLPKLIRPLLSWRRSEIEEVLSVAGREHREDSTNRDTSIPRNRVRHVLLPLLRREFAPGIDRALNELAARAREAQGDLESFAERAFYRSLIEKKRGTIRLDLDELSKHPPTVRRLAIDVAFADWMRSPLGAPEKAPDGRRLAEFSRWLDRAAPAKTGFSLGPAVRARRKGSILVLTARKSRSWGEAGPDPVELAVPGKVRWGNWEVRVERVADPKVLVAAMKAKIKAEKKSRAGAPLGTLVAPLSDFVAPLGDFVAPLSELVDASTLAGPLLVRSRGQGDRFHPLGSKGKKKLKEFLRERGVDPEDRSSVPLVTDRQGIVWVVGHRIAHPYRIRAETRHAVQYTALQFTARKLRPAGKKP